MTRSQSKAGRRGWSLAEKVLARLICCAGIALSAVCQALASADGYKPPAPTLPVDVMRCDWHDAVRNREVPAKIYYPKSGGGPFPVIIFSHGLGASREACGYLGRHWAGCGYISVHLQHHGSDNLVWKNAGLLEAPFALKEAANETNAINRAWDVRFAIDELLKLGSNTVSRLHNRLDPQAIGVAGHSFGGWTAMAVAGQRSGPKEIVLTEPRVKAALAMSAPVPATPGERDRAFTEIKIPVFLMTGTLDVSPLGETTAAERRIIFDKSTNPDTCLMTLAGANHFSFCGGPANSLYSPMICDGSTAFWDAYLRSNKAAREWLYNGGYTQELGSKGVFEKKSPVPN